MEVVNRILQPPELSNPLLWVQINALETNLLILLSSGVLRGRKQGFLRKQTHAMVLVTISGF